MAEATKEINKTQGYDGLDKFYLLNNKRVDNLCSIMKKLHTLASGAMSGHVISNLAREHLKLMIFAMKHYKCVSRKIDLKTLTKKDIIAFSQQRQMGLSFNSLSAMDGHDHPLKN